MPNLRLEFTYDSQGRRVRKQVLKDNQLQESRYFLYDGWNLIYEYSLNAANIVKTKASYVLGLDASGTLQGAGGVGGLLWMNNLKDSDAEREGSHFTAYDHNGNVIAFVESETGTVTASYEYGPFGEAIRSSGPRDAPVSIFDLKTGSATLTHARIQQIQSHIPGGANVPVFQVKP